MEIGNTGYLTEESIRIFLRDKDPEANLLLDDFEFASKEIFAAMTDIVDKWNETPPFVQIYSVESFPFRYHMKLGACAILLRMAAHRFRRNQLDYTIGGGSVQDQNKDKDYTGAADRLMAEFNEWLLRAKVSFNMENGWGLA